MKTVNEILEDIQQAQVDAGGVFMRQSEIKKMTVGELLDLLVPNGVDFHISHNPRLTVTLNSDRDVLPFC